MAEGPPEVAHGASTSTVPTSSAAQSPMRIEFVDGIRAAAALYVVLHHTWITFYPDYRVDPGPWYLRWLAYGYLAVAVFIVVSGFSLAIAPARHEWRLTRGPVEFLRRRAWRILPTYWAALALSALVFGVVTRQQTGANVTTKAMAVHAVLVQDIIDTPKPNGAFWSIAVEWQIYFLFPLLLLLARRWGLAAMVVLTTAAVLTVNVLGNTSALFGHLLNLNPVFLALFALGIAAADVVATPLSLGRARALTAVAAGLSVALVVAFVIGPLAWVEDHYFWLALVVGAVTASLLATLTAGRPRGLGRFLTSSPMRFMGLFSYSIYCVHLPLLWLSWHFVVSPIQGVPTEASFWLLVAIGGPAVLVGSYLFSQVFERPFLTRRSFAQWRSVVVRSSPPRA